MPIVIMLISAFAIIALVKYGLVPGIDRLSAALGWSLKARGKATGYATSVPSWSRWWRRVCRASGKPDCGTSRPPTSST